MMNLVNYARLRSNPHYWKFDIRVFHVNPEQTLS